MRKRWYEEETFDEAKNGYDALLTNYGSHKCVK